MVVLESYLRDCKRYVNLDVVVGQPDNLRATHHFELQVLLGSVTRTDINVVRWYFGWGLRV